MNRFLILPQGSSSKQSLILFKNVTIPNCPPLCSHVYTDDDNLTKNTAFIQSDPVNLTHLTQDQRCVPNRLLRHLRPLFRVHKCVHADRLGTAQDAVLHQSSREAACEMRDASHPHCSPSLAACVVEAEGPPTCLKFLR